ncbi:TPR end-of-group domain-containing protein [Geminocystis sp. CENA526]|uniref:TPR end-of-group domain-containing protein n=1 Tax=Geminocystis sp. CENA526 TaxID=1355871 RepID=UPI003D6EF8B2
MYIQSIIFSTSQFISQIACCYALSDNSSGALRSLKQAIKLDKKYREKIKTDSDFDSLRNEPEFQSLMN